MALPVGLALTAGTELLGPRGRYRLLRPLGAERWAAMASDGRAVVAEVQRFDARAGWDAILAFERRVELHRALEHPGLPASIEDFPIRRGSGAGAGAVEALVHVGEVIDGPSLRAAASEGGLSPIAMVTWLNQILDVLVYLHGRAPPVCHGDLHPGQVLLGRDGHARLLGLGTSASAVGAAGLGDGGGTFGFAAPERLAGPATVAGDLFALGMTFLSVATGQAPEDLPRERGRVVLRDLPNVTPPLGRLLASLVDPDPDRRPASAAHARASLAPILRRLGGGVSLDAGVPVPLGAPMVAARTIPEVPGVEAYLDDLTDRLTAAGCSHTRGGLLGESMLALEAHAARDDGPPLHVYVVRAGELEGAAGGPVGPIPAALFAQAAAGAAPEAHGLGERLGVWLGAALGWSRAAVVPVIVAPAGFGPTVAGHLAASLREPEGTAIICGLVDLRARRLEVVRPRSLAAGDPAGLLARVRGLLGQLDPEAV